MGTIAINKAVGKAQPEKEILFPTLVFQKVECKTWIQRDIIKFLYYARNKSLLCLAGKMEKIFT